MLSRWKVGLLTLGGVTLSLWLATPAPAAMLPVRTTGQHGAHCGVQSQWRSCNAATVACIEGPHDLHGSEDGKGERGRRRVRG